MNRKTITATLACTLLVLCSGNLTAQTLGLRGVGARLNFIDPENPVSGQTIGIGAHADLGEIIPQLILYPSVDYWGKSGYRSVTFNGDVRYYLPTQGQLDFFAGGGLAVSFLRIPRIGGAVNDNEVGLNFLGGVDFPVIPNLTGTIKIKFLVSDPGALKISGGVTFTLPN